MGEKIRTLPEEREIIRGGGERCRIERPICSGAEPLEDTISVSYDERKRYTRGEVNGQLWLEKLENLPPSRGVSGASCNQTGTTGFSSIDFAIFCFRDVIIFYGARVLCFKLNGVFFII